MKSKYKIYKGSLSYTDRTDWLAPSLDKNTIFGAFTGGEPDVEPAVKAAMKYSDTQRTCIQAGGCIGRWPIRLSQIFDRVITFEPEEVNYQCLLHNVEGIKNLECINAALGSDNTKTVKMIATDRYQGHCGAWWVVPGGDIPVVRIDDLKINDVDMIWLDIEGSELDALIGARETIERCKPIIGFEVGGLGKRYQNRHTPAKWLELEFGYKAVSHAYKKDTLMIPA